MTQGARSCFPGSAGKTARNGSRRGRIIQRPLEQGQQGRENYNDSAAHQRRRYLLHRYWQGALGFWQPPIGDRRAWPLTATAIVLIFGTVAFQYGINLWTRRTFDALQNHDATTVLLLSAIFLPLALGSIGCGMANVYSRMTIQRRWRAWLSSALIDRWLSRGHYYLLGLLRGEHDNPEYRIAQDLRIATDAPVDFVVGVLSAILSALTFIVVLWTIGGTLSLSIGTVAIAIPGFLVIAAVIYAVAASTLMTFIGRRFVLVSEAVNQAEADFRYILTRIRENGESIALLGGEEEERSGLDRALHRVLDEWRRLLGQHIRTTFVSQGSTVIAPVVPIILSAPKFLDGSMTLGEMMQAASAFTIVQAAFGWLVDNYPRLADWGASARRTASLMVSLDALDKAQSRNELSRIRRRETEAPAIRLRDVSVTLHSGVAVIANADVVIEQGERVLVSGESGTGKSTLVRALAGLWPWGDGTIEIRQNARLFLQPQRSYIPLGSLRRAVTYPAPAEQWPTSTIETVLGQVGLGYLAERLDDEAPWDQTLSGGEKQRLGFARLILHRPDVVVLDEATSALDASSQDRLMNLLSTELKDSTTIISVGHRSELEGFHSRKIVLERRSGPAHLVRDIDLPLEGESASPVGGRLRWLGRKISPSWQARRA